MGVNKQKMSGLSDIFIILSNVILQSHFIMCKQSLLQNLGGGGGGGGKVNQLGYVTPHLYLGEFQEMGFCIPAGSICIL